MVLLPLIWLPVAVYSNNEVAQLIDGLWWQKTAIMSIQLERSGSPVPKPTQRIGLSTTLHGYYTVAPLLHAFVLAGTAISLALILSHVAYEVNDIGYASEGTWMAQPKPFQELQAPLDAAIRLLLTVSVDPRPLPFALATFALSRGLDVGAPRISSCREAL